MTGRRWSEQELAILQESTGDVTYEEMEKLLPGRTYKSIRVQFSRLFGDASPRTPWSQEEITLLGDSPSNTEVAEKLGRSASAVKIKRNRINPTGLPRIDWTEDELAVLSHRELSDCEVAEMLPNRTEHSVNQHRRRNKLTAYRYCVFCNEQVEGRNTLYCDAHRGVYTSWKNVECGARKRGHAFELTLQQFHDAVWGKSCSYCGDEVGGYGIDRVDSSRGYYLDNVVPCCLPCNRMKNDSLLDEWYARMERVLSRRNQYVA
jgi:hypothetical protein